MDTDKFKSVAISHKSYNELRELADKYFPIPQSMARTTEYIIDIFYKTWKEDFSKNQYEVWITWTAKSQSAWLYVRVGERK